MSEELVVTEVRSRTVGPGRSVCSSRNHHFVIDEPVSMGGPGEALTPAEVFLAGISGCGVLLVQSFARQEGMALAEVRARIEGIRTKGDPANFREVRLSFEVEGADLKRAEHLVERFKGR